MPGPVKVPVPMQLLHEPASSSATPTLHPKAADPGNVLAVFDRVLRKPRVQPGTKKALDREAVIRMWLCILLHDVDAHSLGQMLAENQGDGAAIVSQALDGKATSTLLKRARSIGNMFRGLGKNTSLLFQ